MQALQEGGQSSKHAKIGCQTRPQTRHLTIVFEGIFQGMLTAAGILDADPKKFDADPKEFDADPKQSQAK